MKIVIVQVQVHHSPHSKCFRPWDKLGHNWSSLGNIFSAYFSFLTPSSCAFSFIYFIVFSAFYASSLRDRPPPPRAHTSVPNCAVKWWLMSHKMLKWGYESLVESGAENCVITLAAAAWIGLLPPRTVHCVTFHCAKGDTQNTGKKMLQKFRGKRSFFLPKKERSGEGRKITEHIVEKLAFKLKPKRLIHQEDRRISKPV